MILAPVYVEKCLSCSHAGASACFHDCGWANLISEFTRGALGKADQSHALAVKNQIRD